MLIFFIMARQAVAYAFHTRIPKHIAADIIPRESPYAAIQRVRTQVRRVHMHTHINIFIKS